jgi:acetoin utilization protein AcuB
MLTVADYMTPHPHTIGRDISLAVAHEMMRQHHIRHLPVLDGGSIVGLVSQRDLYFLESIDEVDLSRVTVEEAMTESPFVVKPEASLRDVVEEMTAHRYGTAIVAEGARMVGIFTAIDAMRALLDLTKGEAPKAASKKQPSAH